MTIKELDKEIEHYKNKIKNYVELCGNELTDDAEDAIIGCLQSISYYERVRDNRVENSVN